MNMDAVSVEQITEMRQQHTARLLQQANRAFGTYSISKLRERGHTGLTLAHTSMLPHMDLEGTRITVLAERAGMTKQSMGQLVSDLEEKGYVVRENDPSDRRATLVTFTDLGWQFLRDAYELKKEIEGEYEHLLGEEGIQQLRESLKKLIEWSNRQGEGDPANRPL